jgi:hypothetical protein
LRRWSPRVTSVLRWRFRWSCWFQKFPSESSSWGNPHRSNQLFSICRNRECDGPTHEEESRLVWDWVFWQRQQSLDFCTSLRPFFCSLICSSRPFQVFSQFSIFFRYSFDCKSTSTNFAFCLLNPFMVLFTTSLHFISFSHTMKPTMDDTPWKCEMKRGRWHVI